MYVKLNVDKCSMIFIGPLSLNFNDPGPIEIDLESLSDKEIRQLIYGHQCGDLFVDNLEELISVISKKQSEQRVEVQKQTVIQKKFEPRDIIEKDIALLKKLLREKIEDIKDAVAVMSPSKIKKLLELERVSKNRKSLITYLEDIYTEHVMSVKKNVGTKDNPVYATPDLGLAKQYLENISSIKETDTEIVSFNPVTKE